MGLEDKILALEALVSNLLKEVASLKAENSTLKKEVKDLRAQLKQNSKNSHKPPSSDLIKTALPRKKGGKRGGKEGHKGNTLKMVKHADIYETHYPEHCSVCGESLEGLSANLGDEVRQVYDIVLQPIKITEHRYAVVKCKCGSVNCGRFPSYATQSAQYGPNIKAFWTVLNNDCRLPFEKIQQLTSDLFDQKVNIATVLNSGSQCYKKLEKVESYIKSKVLESKVVHFDETGVRTAAKNYWVHVASTPQYTQLFGHEKRGKDAMKSESGILETFSGRAVHDSWRSYFGFDCNHALCNAHILRELTAAKEQGRNWAVKMHELLMSLYEWTDKGKSTAKDYELWHQKFTQITEQGDKEEAPKIKGKRGRPKGNKSRNLLERLIQYQNEVLAFAKYKDVPFTNNLAERDIRNIKTKIKVATSFRTYNGLKVYTRIQSFISTLKKHQLNVFTNLKTVFEGKFDMASLR